MAAPVYATDLVDIDVGEGAKTWAEPTATGWTSGAAPAANDTDNFIQNTAAVSKAFNATGVGGMMVNNNSGATFGSNAAAFFWIYFASPQTLDSEANGGLRVLIGSSLAAFNAWIVGGKNTYNYGGWINVAVDPAVAYDYTIGGPTTTKQYFGFCVNNLTAITKGSPCWADAVRVGRELRVTLGDSNGYATFAGAAAYNDDVTRRWGLLQVIDGGYLMKGLLSLGLAATAVDFRDANRSVVIQNTKKVAAAFNGVEVHNASSRVDWTAISMQALGTVSKGYFAVIDNADVNLDSCTFTDMDYFTFLANSAAIKCIFRRCGLVTQGGAIFDGCTFDQPSGAVGMLSDNMDNIDNCNFVSKGTGYALQLTSAHAGTSKTLTNVNFSGYALTDGSTGNEAIYNNSGGAVTITVVGGTVPTIRNGSGASTTIVTSSRTVKVTAQKADGTKVSGARVLLRTAASASGGFPYDVTVTITNSGTTATVSHTSHGLATNDKVQITGASLPANNGVFSITWISANSYSYTMASSPGSNPTGTIKCSFVFLEGTTDANGEISMSKAIGANQSVVGWARKAADLLKQGSLSGTVVTTGDTSFTAILAPDS